MSLSNKKCFLLDMDGTFYLGNNLIEGALDFLGILQEQEKDFYFLTNNSSKNAQDYYEKLNKMGCTIDISKIITSGMATGFYLKTAKPGSRIFLLGTPSLERYFVEEGFKVVQDGDVDFVVLGFDTTLTYNKLWRACDYIREGTPYIATHPDFNCPLPGGKFMPDAGAMMALIEASTGRKPHKIIGKPNKEIVDMVYHKTGYNSSDLAIVGDRLYTDVATGIKSGITSILVLSGETTEENIKSSSIVPDYVFQSIKELGVKLINK